MLYLQTLNCRKNYSKFLSYRSYVWQSTIRGGLPKIFLEEMDFEKYSDFIINFPMLFMCNELLIQKVENLVTFGRKN